MLDEPLEPGPRPGAVSIASMAFQTLLCWMSLLNGRGLVDGVVVNRHVSNLVVLDEPLEPDVVISRDHYIGECFKPCCVG